MATTYLLGGGYVEQQTVHSTKYTAHNTPCAHAINTLQPTQHAVPKGHLGTTTTIQQSLRFPTEWYQRVLAKPQTQLACLAQTFLSTSWSVTRHPSPEHRSRAFGRCVPHSQNSGYCIQHASVTATTLGICRPSHPFTPAIRFIRFIRRLWCGVFCPRCLTSLLLLQRCPSSHAAAGSIRRSFEMAHTCQQSPGERRDSGMTEQKKGVTIYLVPRLLLNLLILDSSKGKNWRRKMTITASATAISNMNSWR